MGVNLLAITQPNAPNLSCQKRHHSDVIQFVVRILPEVFVAAFSLTFHVSKTQSSAPSLGMLELLIQLVLASCLLRFLWNSAVVVHGLGHSLLQALIDRDFSALTLAAVLENQSVAAVAQSCLPLQPLFLPMVSHHPLPWIAVGDRTPWKVRCKASGGLLLNGGAVVATCWLYQHSVVSAETHDLVNAGAPLARGAALTFIAANGVILGSSWSDLAAIATGRADRFFCGNFGFIA